MFNLLHKLIAPVILILSFGCMATFTGCSKKETAVGGAVIGAATGAGIGLAAGGGTAGALIGSGVGALTGAGIGHAVGKK